MPTPEAQEQSFSLANVVPQAPMLNRGVWERIESAVRRLARREGELYVVTGPVFQGGALQALHGRVLVPTSTYKAVYDPVVGAAGAYVCTNTDEPQCRVVSVADLARLTGIDPSPRCPTASRRPQHPCRCPGRGIAGGARSPPRRRAADRIRIRSRTSADRDRQDTLISGPLLPLWVAIRTRCTYIPGQDADHPSGAP